MMTKTMLIITMWYWSLQSQSHRQPTKRDPRSLGSQSPDICQLWPQMIHSIWEVPNPPHHPATCSTRVKHSAQTKSLADKKWNTIFAFFCNYNTIFLGTSKICLYFGQCCVRMFGRSACPLLLLWRLSLWNNPSASECSLDSRGGKGWTERRT